MSSEDQNNIENKKKKARKSQEDKELEAMEVESTAGGKGGGGGQMARDNEVCFDDMSMKGLHDLEPTSSSSQKIRAIRVGKKST